MSSELKNELQNKTYRDAFVAAYVRNGIAFQIRAMREQRGWDQKLLAGKMGNDKLQPVISRYENPDYGKMSVSTLLEIAKAFDVALIVRLAEFTELIEWDSKMPQAVLDVKSFTEDELDSQRSCRNFNEVSIQGDSLYEAYAPPSGNEEVNPRNIERMFMRPESGISGAAKAMEA